MNLLGAKHELYRRKFPVNFMVIGGISTRTSYTMKYDKSISYNAALAKQNICTCLRLNIVFIFNYCPWDQDFPKSPKPDISGL